MLSVLDCLLVKAGERHVSLIALLDLSATFDTLRRSIFLKLLKVTFAVRDLVFEWFASYVHDRSQSVTVDGIVSALSPLVYGVSKGSVLGPVLFTQYSQPLSDAISDQESDNDTEFSQSAQPDEFRSIQSGI